MTSEASRGPNPPSSGRAPLVAPDQTLASVTDRIGDVVLSRPVSWGWLAGLGASGLLLCLLLYSVGALLLTGVGIWGVNVPVAWGFAIVNFVWWIGIGHAGTLISASLLLMHQKWRNSISRIAETVTLVAITCAGLFPLLHLGRPWYFYWLLPYPNTLGVWPQFRSPLVWDVFAVFVYMLVSFLFWYVALIPDLASLRDRARSRMVARIYGVLALGWRGEVGQWRHHQVAYRLLAGLATALVVSVHSVVAWDFAITILPGWHVTLFPPYFVAGAMHSGFAMILALVVPLRRSYGLEEFITGRHLDNLAKLLLATSLILGYSYSVEAFGGWYSGKPAEWQLLLTRLFGSYSAAYWTMVVCNVVVPQALWFRRLRSRPAVLAVVGLTVLVGMWSERYMIVLSSLHRDFLPSSWGPYTATIWDWTLLLGTFGLFFASLCVFLRVLPAVSVFEQRELVLERVTHAASVSGESVQPADRRPERIESDAFEPHPAAGRPSVYGLLAKFSGSAETAEAARRAREAGYTRLEAYAPIPAEDVVEALGRKRSRLPAIVLLAGVFGAITGYFVQEFLNVVDYPLNVGGRPLHLLGNWPAFTVVTFEVTVLLASLSAFLGMLVFNGLPRLHHAVFNAPQFASASRDGFFLCVRADDTRFASETTRQFLDELHPLGVWVVPR